MIDIRKLSAAALLVGLAACARGADEMAGDAAPGPAQDAGGAECGAEDLQSLVGTSVGVLDPSTLPEPRRIIFPNQAVTMDLRIERLNVEIGADDRVARVYCG